MIFPHDGCRAGALTCSGCGGTVENAMSCSSQNLCRACQREIMSAEAVPPPDTGWDIPNDPDLMMNNDWPVGGK